MRWVIDFSRQKMRRCMKASWIKSLLLCSTILSCTVWVGNPLHTYRGMRCFAQESATKAVNANLAQALNAIRRDRKGIMEGFQILRNTDLGNTCPDQLLALIHREGETAQETIWRLGMLIVEQKLTISGKQLNAEYDREGKTGRRARQALCAFAAYQTHRKPPERFLGHNPALPKPKPLDKETLALLARALTEDDPAVRVAAADSVRLAGISDDRFLQPLLKAIDDENTVVSEAASLAAAELGFQRASPLILRRLGKHLVDPNGDSEGDLAACGEPLAPLDSMHLWGHFYSPRYGGGGWIVALGMQHYRPALPPLRNMAEPYEPTEEEKEYLTGGESKGGWENDLAKAILDIENRPHRPAALLEMAEDKRLAGDVRATGLRILDDRVCACVTRDPTTGTPILTDLWRQYYESEILQRVVKLIDDKAPITDRANDRSRLGRLAIEVAANKLDPRSNYYQTRLHSMGKPSIFGAAIFDDKSHPVDPIIVYPKSLLPIRRQFQEKLESLLTGRDGALALEALAVAYPKWGTIERYVDIAVDPKRQPFVRAAAANLLTRQPTFLEFDGGGFNHRMNAPPKTAGKLLPLLEVLGELSDWRQQEAVSGVFLDLLGYPESELSEEQKTARKELLPKLRAMRNSAREKAALNILFSVYGFTRAATALDPDSGDPSDRPRPPDETGVGVTAGPPAKVTARRRLEFRAGIKLLTLAQHGKCLVAGDGSTLSHASGSRIVLLNPQNLGETARTSISDDLPWSSNSAVLGRGGQHVLVFNRYIELNTLKTASVLDVKKAVAKGNVRPKPLAISPNGKLALIHVASFLDSKLDVLALFDLASGRLERIIDVAEEQPVSNACYLNEKEIAVLGHRGSVLAVNLENRKQRVLCEYGPSTQFSPGQNWHMAVLAEGRYLVVSGYKEFVVIETSQGIEVFRKKVEGGNAVPVLGGRFLLYQSWRVGKTPAPVFFCVRVKDGKVMATFGRDNSYETLMLGEQDDVIYAVSHDTLSRLRFRWDKLLQNNESHPKEVPDK